VADKNSLLSTLIRKVLDQQDLDSWLQAIFGVRGWNRRIFYLRVILFIGHDAA